MFANRLQSCLALLPLLTNSAAAVTISTDTIIGPGSVFNGEGITVVDGVDGPTTVRVIEGGSIRGFNAFENSHVILDGGTNTFLSALFGQAKLTMRSGAFGCFDSSCGVISVDYAVVANEQSELHLFGGVFGDDFSPSAILLLNTTIAHIYGQMLSVTEFGTSFSVDGSYADGTQISLGFDTTLGRSQIVLHEIPEPLTRALLCWASVMLLSIQKRSTPLNRPVD